MSSKYAVGSILKEAYILVLVVSVNRRAHVTGASEVLEEDRPREEWIVSVDAFFRLHRGCKVEGEPTNGETLIEEVPGLAPSRERNPDANSPIGCRQLRPSRAVMR